ncbi:MAG: DNA/RNA non-specific endonuclease [Alistipes sp.]|nr:DNA/RNA non-specific endonuclease [Alistipes sp.]
MVTKINASIRAIFVLLCVSAVVIMAPSCEPDVMEDNTTTEEGDLPTDGGDQGVGEEVVVPVATATLTYDECASAVSGYESPKSYTNSYGTWIICAYNHNKVAMQLNGGKVAYIGTPTFEAEVTEVEIETVENYTGDFYICSEAGTTSVAGQLKSAKGGGRVTKIQLESLGVSRFYLRSGNCARISKLTVTYGGKPSSGGDQGGNQDGGDTGDDFGDDSGNTGGGSAGTNLLQWAELPTIVDADNNGVVDGNSTLYYAHHLCAGGERNAQRNGTARNYTVCYSSNHHCPMWVAAPMHSCYHGSAGRNNSYRTDPEIPSSIQYSSKSTGGGCNKGHMLSSHDRTSTVATNKQVFYYTNIAPQYSDTFNTGGGAWNNFEEHLETLICSDTLYVVLGCYFDSFSRNGASASPKKISFGGRNDVSCPTMFYCAMLRTKRGSTGKRVQECSASELQCAAFTLCHKMAKGHEPQAADFMSIAELEKLTGFSYFDNVPNAPKGSLSTSEWL